MALDKIKYEPHPVAPERKRELNASGFKIIDARFKPDEGDDGQAEDSDRATVIAALEAKGVTFNKRLGTDKLRALLADEGNDG